MTQVERAVPLGERRIDATLERLDKCLKAMSAEARQKLAADRRFNVIVTVARLRAMERAEEEVLGGRRSELADAYDRIVKPGEHAGDALVRTFVEVYG